MSAVRYEQISGEYPKALASGMRSVAIFVAPSIAEWVSGKYTKKSMALNISAQNSSILKLFSIFQEKTKCLDAKILGCDKRPGGEYSLTSSNMAAYEFMKWIPHHDIEKMVRDFVDFNQSRLLR